MRTESFRSPESAESDVAVGQISVVIPAYNAGAHLAATLRSVLDQSRPPREIIVVDDGSSDDTVAIAESFGVRVISVANGGPSAARNVGTRAASSEYVAFMDADDLWTPDKLAVQVAAMEVHGKPAFSFSDYRLIDERGAHPRQSELRHHWAFRKFAGKKNRAADTVIFAADNGRPTLYDSFIPPSAVVARRSDILAVGGFDETLRITEDFEFHLRLLRSVPAIAVMQPLLFYRRHNDQVTSDPVRMQAGFFAVADRVAASPERYPYGDARYILATDFLRHRSVATEQARLGDFDNAIASFVRSLKSRPTLSAGLGLLGALVCRTPLGRALFTRIRSAWRNRPWHH